MLVRGAIHEYHIRMAPRLAHIYLCLVVAIALFAIIVAERQQVKRVAMVAVFFRSKSAYYGDCPIVYTKHYRRYVESGSNDG